MEDTERRSLLFDVLIKQMRVFYLLLALVGLAVFLGYLWGRGDNAAQTHELHLYMLHSATMDAEDHSASDDDSEAVQEAADAS